MPTPRKHAELAARYMSDDTLRCWVREDDDGTWRMCHCEPLWAQDCQYYVDYEPPAPTITVCGCQMPAPMQKAPPAGVPYWIEDCIRGVMSYGWHDDAIDQSLLSAGRCFRTREDAQQWIDLNTDLRTGH